MSGKILIVDDVATNRVAFKVKLVAAGYQVVLASDGMSCLHAVRAEQPDLILLDLMLPDISGIEIATRLRADPATQKIPLVIFSAGSDPVARLAALRAGADDFLSKPIDDQTLLARLRSLLRSRDGFGNIDQGANGLKFIGFSEDQAGFEAPGLIALVTDRPETAMHLRRNLGPHSQEKFVILSRNDVFNNPDQQSTAPDVYLIESDLGGPGGGLRLMSELLSRANSRNASFCLMNGVSSQFGAAMAYDLGANDQVDFQASPSEVAFRLRTLVRRKRDADRTRNSVQDGLRMAVIDPLTGLHNRRYGLTQLGTIADRAQLEGTEFAVMVLDLDRFKSVNDRWGHAAGDAVLVEIASRLAANLRDSDLLARIGGEEFLVALPATPLEEAQIVAERLCHAVEETAVVLGNGARLMVTISIGLTVAEGQNLTETASLVGDIVEQADRALMVSKTSGRNQVTISRSAA